jgi:molybdenum cofactor biosynthesis enzyme MoaA
MMAIISRVERGKWKFVTMLNSFHGRTFGALTATAQEKYHKGFGPMLPGFTYVPFGDIEAARQAGLNPVKINMVVLRGLNSDDIQPMMNFTEDIGAVLQLIELEPIKKAEGFYQQYHYSLDEFEREISAKASHIRVRNSMQRRKVYTLGKLDVEIVKPVENTDFCMHCTKLRLTSDGKLKPCLMTQENLLDILTPLRNGENPTVLHRIFSDAITCRKPYYPTVRLGPTYDPRGKGL